MRKLLGLLISLQLMHLSAEAQLLKPLGEGLPGEAIQSVVNGRQLYVLYSGDFQETGRKFGVGIWDGNIWKYLPEFTSDSNARFRSIEFYKDGLYISGNHSHINGNPRAAYVFKWNGRTYEPLLENTPNYRKDFSVNKLLTFRGELLLAGSFHSLFGNQNKHLVRWNGRTFRSFNNSGNGLNGPVLDLLKKEDTLFVAGAFDEYNDIQSGGIIAFVNTQAVRFYPQSKKVQRLLTWNNHIVLVTLAERDVQIESLYGKADLTNGIETIYFLHDIEAYDGKLWACGLFDNDDEEKRFFLLYNEGKWQDVGNANLPFVRELNVYQNQLITAGNFQNFRNVPLKHIAILENDFGMLEGRVYFDLNSDCVFDRRDIAAPYWLLVANPGGYLIRANLLGEFRAFLPEGRYNIRPVFRKNLEVPSCINTIQQIEVRTAESNSDLNFPIALKPDVRDLNVQITSAQGFRAIKERKQEYKINYRNIGSLNSGPTKLELRFNNKLNFERAVPGPDSILENKLVWLFDNINPGVDNNIDLILEIPNDLNQEELQFEAQISSQLEDDDPSDNRSELEQSILESEQFNSKQVYPEGGHPTDFTTINAETEDIHYFINFGNFSTDTVKSVTIIDTIDLNLELQYIQETGSSHNYTTQLQSGPPGSNIGILIWHFNNINLSPNPNQISDMPGYSGYMSFKIGVKQDLPPGTKITNRAQIIYDYQSAFQTNEVVCEMSELMHSSKLSHDDHAIQIYPNPASKKVRIMHEQFIEQILITNQQGQLIKNHEQLNARQFDLDVSNFAPGLYVINVRTADGYAVRKLLVSPN